MNVYQKLQTARVELQKRPLKKSGYNGFSKFNYFQLDDFLPNVNEIFGDIGLCSHFTFEGDSALLTIVNADEPKETLIFSSPIAESGIKGATPIQNLGGVHTYMRRYLWIMAMEIVEHDSIDSLSPADREEKPFIDMDKPMPQNMISKLKSIYTPEQLAFMVERRGYTKLEEVPWSVGSKWILERPQLNVTDDVQTF